MRVYSFDCTFDYSWEEVSTANWRKYCPWNKSSNHVVAVDTLSRFVDPSTGIVCLVSVFSKSTGLLYLAPNRTIDNLHANSSSLGSLATWRVNNFTCLRNLLRVPYGETSDHVLDKPDLEQRVECSGNGCLQT